VEQDRDRGGDGREREEGLEEADHASRDRVCRYSPRQSASGCSVTTVW
jgi:hypothetical protein